MIVVFVNSMEDTATFSRLYDGLEDITLLYNPTREEVENVLRERPTERLMCLGHGSSRGLFSHDFKGYIIDRDTTPLLRTREMIGIWCYASDFARLNNLRGFFTYMFISNPQEANAHRCGEVSEDVVFEENRLFSQRVNNLIREDVPMEDWVERLYESANTEREFVNFNYSNLSYFDGENNYVPQSLLDEERSAEPYLFDETEWEEGTLWHDYRIEEEESYVICYIDNDGRNVWEEYNEYDKAIDRYNDLSAELNEENAEKIMLFNRNTEI